MLSFFALSPSLLPPLPMTTSEDVLSSDRLLPAAISASHDPSFADAVAETLLRLLGFESAAEVTPDTATANACCWDCAAL